ncbi:hypothetical protein L3X38_018411 [Prunus dulcis]|uniref:Uncharacterized protein n=1 Tax=Prunus dulcis TaxID=3755 RepID=A0AAD4WAR8_PRUDU|nr:hypothetical protein L3X38_018411 [Prunus dulcis]
MVKVLNNLCLGAELKASPQSKLKVDSNEAWETYVQHHKNAAEWRNKSFPLFDRLADIFGKDRANGKGAEVPSKMMEEQAVNNEVVGSDDNDTSPMSINKEGNQYVVWQNKRKTGSSDEDRVVFALEKLFEVLGKRMQMVIDSFLKGNENRSNIAKEVKEVRFSAMDQCNIPI